MNILFLCGREIEYPRNDVLVRALNRFADVDVIAESGRGRILARSLRLTWRAIPYLRRTRYDLVVVGFYGHLLMLTLGRMVSSPLLFDAFVSTYDTLVGDRGAFQGRSILGRLAFWLDRTAASLADHVLLDTSRHVDYYTSTFGLAVNKFSALPVGCNEEVFAPSLPTPKRPLRVLYYCTYLPLHGAETVVQAAAQLGHNRDLSFRLVGEGPRYAAVRKLAEELELPHVTFIPTLPIRDLASEIAASHICLGGHFGRSEKAARVVPGKVYQILAMARPLIAADTPANRDLLDGPNSAFLVPQGDPASLAAAIDALADDVQRREALGSAGRGLYERCCSEAVITRRMQEVVSRMSA